MAIPTGKHRQHALWLALAIALGAGAAARAAESGQPAAASDAPASTAPSASARKAKTLSAVTVDAQPIGGGLMISQDAPKQVSTISAQAIAEQPGTADYTQLINSMPGVNAASSDGFGLTDYGGYSIRGFSSSEIGVTLDGVPVNDAGNYVPYTAEYGEARNYESVSVSQGSSDLDAPNLGAVGGHISFVTKAPTHDFNIYYGQSLGSDHARSSFVRINTGDTGPVRSWISFSDNSNDKWRGGGQERIERVQGKSVWTIDDNNSLTANFNYNRERNYLYEYLSKSGVAAGGYKTDYSTQWVPPPAGGFTNDQLYSAPASLAEDNYYKLYQNPFVSWVASLDGEFKLGDNLALSVIPYFQYGDGDGSFPGFLPLQFGTGGQPTVQADQSANGQYAVYEAYRAITYRPGITTKFTLDAGANNELDWGFWYERSRQQESINAAYVDPATGEPSGIWGDSNLLTYANGKPWINYAEYDVTTVKKVYLEDSWNPADAWTFNAGVAYLYSERDNSFQYYPGNPEPSNTSGASTDERYHKVLPTLGVSWRPNENNQIYYSITRTFRAPVDASTFGNTPLGLPPPKPESAWSNDLGWRYDGGALSLHADAYLALMGNRTATGVDENTFISYYINAGPVRMAGFNAEANLDLGHGFSLYSSYTYTQAKVKQNLTLPVPGSPDEVYATAGKQFPGTPRNMAYLGARFARDGWIANLNAKFTGSEYGDFLNTDRVASNIVLNGSLSYQLPDFNDIHKTTIALNALNLLNRRYLALPYSSTIDAAESAPTYYVGAPRQFFITLSTTFF